MVQFELKFGFINDKYINKNSPWLYKNFYILTSLKCYNRRRLNIEKPIDEGLNEKQ